MLMNRSLRHRGWHLPVMFLLGIAAAQTTAEWNRCCADAERWLLRASMLGGERAIRLGAADSAAAVTIRYAVTMGVRHPDGADGVTCQIPASASWDGPALAAV